jgi:hypothetical protein
MKITLKDFKVVFNTEGDALLLSNNNDELATFKALEGKTVTIIVDDNWYTVPYITFGA